MKRFIIGLIISVVVIMSASGCSIVMDNAEMDESVVVAYSNRLDVIYGSVYDVTRVNLNTEVRESEEEKQLFREYFIDYFKRMYIDSYSPSPTKLSETARAISYSMDYGITVSIAIESELEQEAGIAYVQAQVMTETEEQYTAFKARLRGMTQEQYEASINNESKVEYGSFYNRRIYEVTTELQGILTKYKHKQRDALELERNLVLKHLFETEGRNVESVLGLAGEDNGIMFNYAYATMNLNGSNGISTKEPYMNIFQWNDIGERDEPMLLYNTRPNLPVWYLTAILSTVFLTAGVWITLKILNDKRKSTDS